MHLWQSTTNSVKQSFKISICAAFLQQNSHRRLPRANPPPSHNRFTAIFPGPLGWAGARRELPDFMVQGKRLIEADTPIIRMGATPSGLSSVPTSTIPHLLQTGCPSATQPTVSKHWRQLAHSDWEEDARVLLSGVTCTVSVPWSNSLKNRHLKEGEPRTAFY